MCDTRPLAETGGALSQSRRVGVVQIGDLYELPKLLHKLLDYGYRLFAVGRFSGAIRIVRRVTQ